MTVSSLDGPSSLQETRQLSTDKDDLFDVKDQIGFLNVDPHALISALDRLHSGNTQQITPRVENAPQQEQEGANVDDIELSVVLPGKLDASAYAESKSAHGGSTTSHDSPRIIADQQAVQQKKCCVIL